MEEDIWGERGMAVKKREKKEIAQKVTFTFFLGMLASASGQIQEERKGTMNCPAYIRGRILCGMLAGM